MTPTRIIGGEVVTPGGLRRHDVVVIDDTIESVAPPDALADGNVIDAAGLTVSPGFVDLQINGGFGVDLACEPLAMWDLGRRLPEHGVTAFLPTIITSPAPVADAALAAMTQRPEHYLGAEPLGIHFEGPMLSPQRPGAHPVEHLAEPHLDVIDKWSKNSGVAMVTLAPDLPGATEIIAELSRRGVTVAAGHTNATSTQTQEGRNAGVSVVTHLFNAMAPLSHRHPNLVGVAMADPTFVAGLIADGVHVDPLVVAAAWNAKGPEGIVLVTDAVAAMGQPPGTYQFAGSSVTADETSVRNGDGTLAGSVLTMDRAVRNLVSCTRCSPSQALASATSTPAGVIGQTRRGRIEPDRLADIVLLDQNLEVQITLCGGRVAHFSATATARVPTQLRESI